LAVLELIIKALVIILSHRARGRLVRGPAHLHGL
jgi:hypothetical protein